MNNPFTDMSSEELIGTYIKFQNKIKQTESVLEKEGYEQAAAFVVRAAKVNGVEDDFYHGIEIQRIESTRHYEVNVKCYDETKFLSLRLDLTFSAPDLSQLGDIARDAIDPLNRWWWCVSTEAFNEAFLPRNIGKTSSVNLGDDLRVEFRCEGKYVGTSKTSGV